MGAALALMSCEQPAPEAPTEAPETPPVETAAVDPVERGAYLLRIAGCNDCHTPGHLLGNPDFTRAYSGGDVGFFMPGLGYVFAPNLTPDPETGLGNWTEDQIVTALRTGVRPDGRVLLPIMPWPGLAALTDEDTYAMAAYLKSLAPIVNQVPPLTAADQPAPGNYMTVVIPEGMEPPPPPPAGPPPW
jgi:mono/diheme cytochrome c family protein